MIFVYRLLTTLLTPLVLAGFVARSLQQPAFRRHLNERLGWIKNANHAIRDLTHDQQNLLIHGASVGEILALKPFIEALLTDCPQYRLTVTCFTPTGREAVAQHFADRVNYGYLPWDSLGCVKRFLQRIQPNAMVIMETELWPNLIARANTQGVKLLLINARLSDRSVKRYRKLAPLITPSLQAFDSILAQSDDNRARFITLGAASERTLNNGNMKCDIPRPMHLHAQAELLRHCVRERLVWVVGSTHPDEEALIIATFQQLKNEFPHLLLVVAPRHKERFAIWTEQLTTVGLSYIQRSTQGKEQVLTAIEQDVWLIDTLGELLLFYGIGDLCTVAGSFGSTGGHNPLEPGLWAKATTLGPNMANARQLVTEMLSQQAVLQHQTATVDGLVHDIGELLSDNTKRLALGQTAATFIHNNTGATERACGQLKRLLAD